MLKKYAHFFIIGLLTIHTILLNGYFYGYGFNYIPFGYNLPPIFARIDTTLYPRDMYVQSSIHQNTFFFDIIVWATEYIPIEKVAFFLCTLSLYFILLAIFFLTVTLFNNRKTGYCAILFYAFGLRQWTLGEPGIYVGFLDAGTLAYPTLIFALTFFLRKHYFVSFFLVGLIFNIHLPYALNLLFLFLCFLIYQYRLLNLKFVFFSLVALMVPAIPFFPILPSLLQKTYYGDEWFQAIRISEWFHHLPSQWGLQQYLMFFIFLIFFLMTLQKSPKNEKHLTVIILLVAMTCMCLLSTVFIELVPIPFFIKLHVWNYGTWIFYFIAITYLANFLVLSWDQNILKQFAIIGVVLLTAGYLKPYWLLPILLTVIVLFNFKEKIKGPFKFLISFTYLILLYFLLSGFIPLLSSAALHISPFVLLIFLALFLLLLFNKFAGKIVSLQVSKWVIVASTILFFIFFDFAFLYQRGGPHINYRGFAKKNAPPWVDLQFYARDHTPVDALFIVPPYLEGFTVFSRRSIFVDWIIGTTCVWGDNEYAAEWLKRIRLLGWDDSKIFKDLQKVKEGYDALSTEKIQKIAKEYNASYVVFKKTKRLNLPVVYENDEFTLYAAGHEENRQRKGLQSSLQYFISQKDNVQMIRIPEGAFLMGSDTGEDDEKPVHKVYIDAFYIDMYEVTVEKYCRFLNDHTVSKEQVEEWLTTDSKECLIVKKGKQFFAKTGYKHYPVAGITWHGANAYAIWAGKRLPTEAEWEYAARGGLKQKLYPWGNADPADGTRANYKLPDDGYEGFAPVASFASNGYGLYDMAGNVWEWCSDWYNPNYYVWSTYRNPWNILPKGTFRVRRGGSWNSGSDSLRTSYRSFGKPFYRGLDVGFRCCK